MVYNVGRILEKNALRLIEDSWEAITVQCKVFSRESEAANGFCTLSDICILHMTHMCVSDKRS